MDVSVIIINYNTFEETKNCLDSVFERTSGVSFEVILVDNASTDQSREMFEADARIQYVYNEKNLGFGRANNIGIERSTGRNILFLNSDTVLKNDAISILCRYLDEHPAVGIVGGNLYGRDGQPTHSYRRYLPSFYSEISEALKGLPDRWFFGDNAEFNHTGQPRRVKQITGADLMIRKKLIDEMGVCFDPDFFMYYEDTELCWRVLKAGHEIVSVPQAEIVHLEGISGKKNQSVRKSQILRNSKNLYLRKCLPTLSRILINSFRISLILLRGLVPPYTEEKKAANQFALQSIRHPNPNR